MRYSLQTYLAWGLAMIPTVLSCGVVAATVMAGISAALPSTYSSTAVIDTGTVGENRGIDMDGINAQLNHGGWRAAVGPGTSVRKVWLAFSKGLTTLRVDAADAHTAREGAARLAAAAMAAYSELPPFREDQRQTSLPAGPAVAELRSKLAATSAGLRRRASELAVDADRMTAARGRASQRLRLLAGVLRTAAGTGTAETLAVRARAVADELESLLEGITTGLAAETAKRQEIAAVEQLADLLDDLARRPVTSAVFFELRRLGPRLGHASAQELTSVAARVQEMAAEESTKAVVTVRPVSLSLAPTLPHASSWPKTWVNVAIAFLFGCMAGVLIAVLRRYASSLATPPVEGGAPPVALPT